MPSVTLAPLGSTAQQVLHSTLHTPSAPSQRLHIPLKLVEAHVVELLELVCITLFRRSGVGWCLRLWRSTKTSHTTSTTAHSSPGVEACLTGSVCAAETARCPASTTAAAAHHLHHLLHHLRVLHELLCGLLEGVLLASLPLPLRASSCAAK